MLVGGWEVHPNTLRIMAHAPKGPGSSCFQLASRPACCICVAMSDVTPNLVGQWWWWWRSYVVSLLTVRSAVHATCDDKVSLMRDWPTFVISTKCDPFKAAGKTSAHHLIQAKDRQLSKTSLNRFCRKQLIVFLKRRKKYHHHYQRLDPWQRRM